MPTKRGAVLKKLRFYLSQMPPENVLPHKKLNATTRGMLEGGKGLQESLGETIEQIQQRIFSSFIRQKARRDEF